MSFYCVNLARLSYILQNSLPCVFPIRMGHREILTRSGGQKKGISSFITDIHFYQSMDSRH